MIFKPCFYCKADVDVDGYGNAGDVYCEKHMDLGKLRDNYIDIEKTIIALRKKALIQENEYNEMYAKIINGKELETTILEYAFPGLVNEMIQLDKTTKHQEGTRIKARLSKIPQEKFNEIMYGVTEGYSMEFRIRFKIKKIDVDKIKKHCKDNEKLEEIEEIN